MGVILKHLATRAGILDSLCEAFQEGKPEIDGRGLRLGDLMGMFKTAIASLPQVFICDDALDGCLPKCLVELLRSLRVIVLKVSSTRIFLTGGPQVWEDIQRYFIARRARPEGLRAVALRSLGPAIAGVAEPAL